MSTRAVFAAVRAAQADDFSLHQRNAIAELLLALHVAVEVDSSPGPAWRPVLAAFDELLHGGTPAGGGGRGGNVVRLRPCPGEGA